MKPQNKILALALLALSLTAFSARADQLDDEQLKGPCSIYFSRVRPDGEAVWPHRYPSTRSPFTFAKSRSCVTSASEHAQGQNEFSEYHEKCADRHPARLLGHKCLKRRASACVLHFTRCLFIRSL